tara:strand:+ start:970 stop:2445 length:1476 start_codon:yes stop_codon:yes gene_type:complete
MGGVRTALYNYLFAKKHGGAFLLRIEDTDQTRYVPGAEDYVVDALKWCGMTIDEGASVGGDNGPYRQSERKPMYRKYTEMLLESKHAYYAFDTPEELTEMRERLKAAGMAAPQYNAVTRNGMKNSLTLSSEEVEKRLAAGDKYIVRVKMPRNEDVKFEDNIRGWVSVNTNNLDDKVLFKSDGMPTYHLANVVDDYLMNISHVIRGEEWLPSAPLHVLLYRFFGWADVMPQFAHLPLILRPDGNGKLSKRDGDRLGFPVFPTNWKNPETGEQSSGYRERGYYPDAFNNMLAFLGWNPGTTQELFTMEELVQAFSLERVGKAGAKFDFDKTNWFNQQYLRKHNGLDLAAQLKPYLEAENLEAENEYTAQVCDLMKERATFVQDILMEGRYFFEAPTSFDEKTIKKKWKEQTPAIITQLSALLKELPSFDAESIGACFKSFLEAKELGFGAVMPGFRLSVTGLGAGASMNDIAALLGKEEVLRRIEIALNTIKK